MRRREPRRYEITHVPAPVRNRDRQAGVGEPVLKRYERIAFDKALLAPADPPPRPRPSRARGSAETPPAASPSRPEAPSAAASSGTARLGTRTPHPDQPPAETPPGALVSRPQGSTAAAAAAKPDGAPPSSRQPPAAFICPGHPLLDAVLDLTLERGRGLLQRGAVLVNERDPGVGVRVLFTLEHAIRDGSRLPNGEGRTISRRLLYVELDADGRARRLRHAPYLDYRPLAEGEPAAADVLARPECAWIGRELEAAARREAIAHVVPEHVAEVRGRRLAWIDKTRAAVKERLTKEIAHWDHQADRLKLREQAGKAGAGAGAGARLNSGEARRRADDLQERLA